MDAVLRSAVIYIFLLIIFRLSGKRSLSQITTFDFVLLLIISESIQQAMVGDDFSITNSMLIIITLVGMDVGLSLLKQRSPRLDKLMDSVPIILVDNGKLLSDRMSKARVNEEDILSAGRELQGLERIEQIKYAVLERGGHISIIPKSQQ